MATATPSYACSAPAPIHLTYSFFSDGCTFTLPKLLRAEDYPRWADDMAMVLSEPWLDDNDTTATAPARSHAQFPSLEDAGRQARAVRTVFFACGPAFQEVVMGCRTVAQAREAVRRACLEAVGLYCRQS